MVYVFFQLADWVEWQEESGYSDWNNYRGDLDVLRGGGVYTRVPGSNDLAARNCATGDPWVEDSTPRAFGKTAFFLITGAGVSGEGSLGANSGGAEQINTLTPCP